MRGLGVVLGDLGVLVTGSSSVVVGRCRPRRGRRPRRSGSAVPSTSMATVSVLEVLGGFDHLDELRVRVVDDLEVSSTPWARRRRPALEVRHDVDSRRPRSESSTTSTSSLTTRASSRNDGWASSRSTQGRPRREHAAGRRPGAPPGRPWRSRARCTRPGWRRGPIRRRVAPWSRTPARSRSGRTPGRRRAGPRAGVGDPPHGTEAGGGVLRGRALSHAGYSSV